jgi:alpha-tubulin suppressor-like RCC1 family protein
MRIHSAAITANGDLYTWGDNFSGQLGHGNTGGSISTPTRVEMLSNVVAVSLGGPLILGNSAAIDANGDLYTWGNNMNGQLGHGDILQRNTPTKVKALSNVAAISVGIHNENSTAITAEGHLYTWGTIPTRVAGLSNVVAVSSGQSHSAAMTANGHLYTWGANANGQLGDGTTADRHNPVRIWPVSSDNGTVPPTGIPGIAGYTLAMLVFLLISAALWGYILRRRPVRGKG